MAVTVMILIFIAISKLSLKALMRWIHYNKVERKREDNGKSKEPKTMCARTLSTPKQENIASNVATARTQDGFNF